MDINVLIDAFKPFAKLLFILAVAVFIAIAMDYLTGTLAAKKNNEWSSQKAREGIWHKVGIVIAVLLAALFDAIIVVATQSVIKLPFNYCGLFAPLVALCYVITELGSIVENIDKMGTPVPAFLKKGLAAFAAKVDDKADSIVPGAAPNTDAAAPLSAVSAPLSAELHTETYTLGEAVEGSAPVDAVKRTYAAPTIEHAESPDEETWE